MPESKDQEPDIKKVYKTLKENDDMMFTKEELADSLDLGHPSISYVLAEKYSIPGWTTHCIRSKTYNGKVYYYAEEEVWLQILRTGLVYLLYGVFVFMLFSLIQYGMDVVGGF